jgi:hypothetical protein
MHFRSDDEIRASFRRVEAILDKELAAVTVSLTDLEIDESRSNRSGFDKSGFPYFVWECEFRRDQPFGAEIERVVAIVRYMEPIEERQPGAVKASWRYEIFQRGASSRVDRRGERVVPLADVEANGLEALVRELLSDARQAGGGSMPGGGPA